MEKERVLELSLILIFVGILLIFSIVVLTNNGKEDKETLSQQTINNYKIEYTVINPVKIIQNTGLRERICYISDEEKRDSITYWEDSDQERRKEFLGNYVQEYYVYVLNKERTGRYFTVVFEFEDKNGYVDRESITQYIKAGEKKKFAYRDIQFERNEIVDWDYEVIPEEY